MITVFISFISFNRLQGTMKWFQTGSINMDYHTIKELNHQSE